MNPLKRRPSLLHALLLAACLLAAQWGGGVHRIEHRALGGVPAAVAADEGHGHGGHERGTAECLLIDHALAQADAWLPALALPLAVLRHAAPALPAVAARATAAAVPYLARGPPDSRA